MIALIRTTYACTPSKYHRYMATLIIWVNLNGNRMRWLHAKAYEISKPSNEAFIKNYMEKENLVSNWNVPYEW